jgi:hypothetical protein
VSLNSIDPIITINDIQNFEQLKKNSRASIHNITDSENLQYEKQKDVLKIIHTGFTELPNVYRDSFLNPFLNFIENEKYEDVFQLYDANGSGPLLDWLLSINQRVAKGEQPFSKATKAFQEFCQDIFDGYLSLSSRKGAKLPEHQIIAPLVKWGGNTPYTWPATMGSNLNMKMSFVSLPSTYSDNIALWPLCAHECYHDIIHADEGLLNELEDIIYHELISDTSEELKKKILWNGSNSSSVAEFAAKYWRTTMEETAADVCALLNVGPCAGISFALLALSLNNNTLESSSSIADPHPNEALRISLAAEVTKQFEELDLTVRNEYINFFDQIMSKYMKNNNNNNKNENNFVLYSTLLDGEHKHHDVEIPYSSMKKTVEIVARVIGFTKLKSLENHSLSEFNTWTNHDQILTQRIAAQLMQNQKEEAETVVGPDEQEVYATHIVAAATLASIKKPDIAIRQQNSESITNAALKTLEQLYNTSPVWKGYSVIYRSDVGKHSIISYKKK